MKLQRRGVLIAAPLAALALVASACGGGGGDSGGGNDNQANAKHPSVEAVDINATPRDQIKDGGTLRWPIDQFSTQWNYNQLNGPEVSTSAVISALLPGPFTFDAKAVPHVAKDYVLDVKLTTEPKQVVTYTLNPKATWYDGTPVTWKDYQAQWKALNGKNKAYQVASTTGYDQIASVEQGKDQFEVVVTYAKPFADWQSLFSPLYPASTNNDPKAFNKGWVNKILTTAGPFKLDKIDQTAKTITLVRNEKWWGDKAKLDKIVYRAMTTDAMKDAFANGEVDLFDIGPDPDAYKQAKGVQGADIRKAGGPDFRHFTFNATSPMLQDVNVRKAVAMGINREAVAKSDLKGLDWPTTVLNNHIFMSNQEGYQDNSGDIKYNPDKAKQLLDQAGWKMQGDFRQKGGKQLSLRFVIPSGVSVSANEAKLTQAMLKQIGVKVNINEVPENKFFDDYIIGPGDFEITAFSWIGTAFPISSVQSIYAKPTKDKNGDLQIQQNFARVGSDALDQKLQAAAQELDPAKAHQLANEADAMIWQEVHSITLYQRPQIRATKATLANYGAFGFQGGTGGSGSPVYQDLGFTK